MSKCFNNFNAKGRYMYFIFVVRSEKGHNSNRFKLKINYVENVFLNGNKINWYRKA